MKRIVAFSIVFLSAVSLGMAQDDAAVQGTSADQPKAAADAPQASPLSELEWMIGTWVDEGDDSKITTKCSWAEGGKFLKRSFTVVIDGHVSLKGTQLVGWDPIEKRIRSWTFDSEGGFGEGRWIKDGSQWLVKTSYVLVTGEKASAVNVIRYIDDDTLGWQSTAREVGGELQPNIPEVKIVRQKAEAKKTPQGEKKEVSQ